jgi:leader peptidase (prepilin peptidase) / N-methyltransferase
MDRVAGPGTLHEIIRSLTAGPTPMPPFDAWWTLVPGAEVALIAAAFAWGAALGSFLNVVLYRVPRGKSVAVGGSRCPRCGAGIRPRDNVPIIGWLALRGRCRACGLPISARYPLVEAACGSLAALVAAAELAGGGGWLPHFAGGSTGVDRILLHGEWRLVASWALHTALLLVVLAWTMLAADGMRRPCCGSRAIIATIIVVVIAIPDIGPLGLWPVGHPWPPERPRLAALAAAVAGAAVGRIVGAATGRPADPGCFAVVGAALGWQAAVTVAAVVAMCRGFQALACAGRRAPLLDSATVVLTTAVHVVAWKPIASLWAAVWRVASGS